MAENNILNTAYLFSGIITDPKTGAFESGSLRPLPNKELFIQSGDGDLEYVFSDTSGKIITVSPNSNQTDDTADQVVSSGISTVEGESKKFCMAPQDFLYDASSIGSDKWNEYVQEGLKTLKDLDKKPINLKTFMVGFDDLMPPKSIASAAKDKVSKEEKAYLDLYKKLEVDKTKKIPVFILPIIRVLYMVSTTFKESFNRVSITITGGNPDNSLEAETTFVEEQEMAAKFNAIGAVISSETDMGGGVRIGSQLVDGFYTFSIDLSDSEKHSDLLKKWREHNKGVIEVTSKVTFDEIVPGFEAAFVRIDPISIEESLLMQYTDKYQELSGLAKADSAADIAPNETSEMLKNTVEWTQKLSGIKGTCSKAFNKYNFLDNESADQWKSTFNTYYALARTQITFPEPVEKAIAFGSVWYGTFQDGKSLIEGGTELRGKYRELRNAFIAREYYKERLQNGKLFRSLANNMESADGCFKTLKLKMRQQQAITSLAEHAAGIMDENPSTWKSKAIGLQRVAVAERIKDGHVRSDKIKDLIFKRDVEFKEGAADIAMSAIELGFAINSLLEANRSLETSRQDSYYLFSAYNKLFETCGNRETLAVLETYRKAVNAKRAGCDQAFLNMLNASLNLILSVAEKIPVAQMPVMLISLVKDSAVYMKDVTQYAVKNLDYVFEGSNIQGFLDNIEEFRQTCYDSYINVSEIKQSNQGDDESKLNAQFRLRAEAITGLYELIQSAGARYDRADIYKFIKKYNIKEYIETFIFCKGDGWVFPDDMPFPMTLGDYWIYKHNKGKYIAADVLATAAATNVFPPALLYRGIVLAAQKFANAKMKLPDDYTKVNFQEKFPIHMSESELNEDSLTKMFQALSLDYSDVKDDAIEHVLVYARKDKTQKWKPIWKWDSAKKRNQVYQLYPLNQIRVCVILKETKEAIKNYDKRTHSNVVVPIKLSILKANGILEDEGPSYTKYSYMLWKNADGVETGLLDEGVEKKYHYKKRLGAVFFPTYEYDGVQNNGLKPFAKNPKYEYAKNYAMRIKATISNVAETYFSGFNEDKKDSSGLFISPLSWAKKKYGEMFPPKLDIPLKLQVTAKKGKATAGDFKNYDVSPDEAKTYWNMANDDTFMKFSGSDGTPKPSLYDTTWKPEIIGVFMVKPYYNVLDAKEWQWYPKHRYKKLKEDEEINFGWNKPFELIILLGVPKINHSYIQSKETDWRKVPMNVQFFHDEADLNDTAGPTYQTNFYYLGYNQASDDIYNKSSKAGYKSETYEDAIDQKMKFEKDSVDSSEVLEVAHKYLKNISGEEEREKHLPLIGGKGYYLYAAHLRVGYDILIENEKTISYDSFRPFGELWGTFASKKREYYLQVSCGGESFNYGLLNSGPLRQVFEVSNPAKIDNLMPPGFPTNLLHERWFMVDQATDINTMGSRSIMMESLLS